MSKQCWFSSRWVVSFILIFALGVENAYAMGLKSMMSNQPHSQIDSPIDDKNDSQTGNQIDAQIHDQVGDQIEESDATDPLIPRPTYWGRAALKSVKENAGWIAIVAIVGAGAGFEAYRKFTQEEEEGVEELWDISGGATAAIQHVLVPAICVPTARVAMSLIQGTKLGSYLGLNHRVAIHKGIAGLFGAAAATHVACSVIGNPHFYQTQEGITGLAMTSAIIAPIAGSYVLEKTPCIRSCLSNFIGYDWRFLHPHQIGYILFIAAYATHLPHQKLLPWAAPAVGVMALDRMIEYLFYTYSSSVIDARIEGDKVVLEMTRPPRMKLKEGQFSYLKVDGRWKMGRWHPMTVAGFDDNKMTFVIGQSGRATRKLFKKVQNGEIISGASVTLTGPFPSPFQHLPERKDLAAISSGSGISVPLILIQKLMNEGQSDLEERKLTLIHSERNIESFNPLIEALSRAQNDGHMKYNVHFFVTGRDQIGASDHLRALEAGLSQPSTINDSDLKITWHQGRLGPDDLAKILQDLNRKDTHAVICGSSGWNQLAEQECNRAGIDFTTETFGF